MSCNSPIQIEHNGIIYEVPCRWCMGCRIDRRNMWSRRIRYDVYDNYKKGYGSSFVTLTYDENHIPENGGLQKKHVQDFIKRLRYYLRSRNHVLDNKHFKYVAVGEYGSQTERCHYHLVFIGLSSGFLTDYVRKSWTYGQTKVDVCTNGRIRYTLKYMDKQIFGDDKIEVKGVKVQAPFMLISKGIGVDYLRKQLANVDELGMYLDNGKKVPYPKYFAKKFGVDTSIYTAQMSKTLADEAKKNNMTLHELSVKKAIINETKFVNSARLGDTAVDSSHIRQAKSKIKVKSNAVEKIMENLNYEE